VGLTIHSLPAPVLPDERRTVMGRVKMLLIVLACAAPVIASYFTFYVIRPQAGTNYGTLITPPRDLPAAAALPLRDLQGQAVDPASLKGQWLLTVVADGACDTTCETLLYEQRQLREMLGRDKDRLDRVWLVTGAAPREALLPAMRDATVLRIDAATLATWLQPAEGQSPGAHLYLIDPMGRWMMRWPAQADPVKVRKDLDRLLRAAKSWDHAGR
jgi:cytochrome oxidase Cu insertion factor (SCO1/SenC/PrrC family)